VEALLIARELYDRRIIRRFAVLAPPTLCEQWENEIREKIALEPVVFRAGTISSLERKVPPDTPLYKAFPFQVISIDWAKTKRNRDSLIQHCPELIIVDEAHGASKSSNSSQQQRHLLLQELAKDPKRHILLLSATPHSGIPESFHSLVGLLHPEAPTREDKLYQHFIQRPRKQIQNVWHDQGSFPERISEDATYELSPEAKELIEKTTQLCHEVVTRGDAASLWGALAIIRCVNSSPRTAIETLSRQAGRSSEPIDHEGEEAAAEQVVADPTEAPISDENPSAPARTFLQRLGGAQLKRIKELIHIAEKMSGSPADTKLQECVRIVKKLIRDGFHPIIWCRYLSTVEYVEQALKNELSSQTQVCSITGRDADDQRRLKLESLDPSKPRVLVATDCLSEGLNLHDRFNAVVHYDLPWNPNRLEQREGRVDRFGQASPHVKAIMLYSNTNPVDKHVVEVLLKKARQIYQDLGVYVPIPAYEKDVSTAVLAHTLFTDKYGQLSMEELAHKKVLEEWDEAVEREKQGRSARLAHPEYGPQEVQEVLQTVDDILGDADSVKELVRSVCERIRLEFQGNKDGRTFRIAVPTKDHQAYPPAVLQPMPDRDRKDIQQRGSWLVSFHDDAEFQKERRENRIDFLGRNHPFVVALANHAFEKAIDGSDEDATRCGVIATDAVNRLTALLLLRTRYLIDPESDNQLLAEEVRVFGFQSFQEPEPLSSQEALSLLNRAEPTSNLTKEEKRELLESLRSLVESWQTQTAPEPFQRVRAALEEQIEARRQELERTYRRLRPGEDSSKTLFRAIHPPDLLGILILKPEVRS